MATNYDATQVGVPYVRTTKLTVTWPDSTEPTPKAIIDQALAVKLADGSVRNIEKFPEIVLDLDFINHGNDDVPLIDPNTGTLLGATTTLINTMVAVASVIRQAQIKAQG